jgi:serine/threonine protein kinase
MSTRKSKFNHTMVDGQEVEEQVLQSFNKFKERFRPVRHLGKGAFGSVFEVIDSFDNMPKALKIVKFILKINPSKL